MAKVLNQWLFLQDVARLIQKIKELGYVATGGELYRTEYQQKEYIRLGLSQTMQSKHLDKMAIDLNFIQDGKIIGCPKAIGDYWVSLSKKNEWGGNWKTFKDSGHFQRNN